MGQKYFSNNAFFDKKSYYLSDTLKPITYYFFIKKISATAASITELKGSKWKDLIYGND